jgi:hypothetical protein
LVRSPHIQASGKKKKDFMSECRAAGAAADYTERALLFPRRFPQAPFAARGAQNSGNFVYRPAFPSRQIVRRNNMGRGLLLWLIGIPLPIILIIWLLGGLHG